MDGDCEIAKKGSKAGEDSQDLERVKKLSLEMEKKGNGAFVDEDYDTSLKYYCQASSLDPSNASFFIRRAQAHIKLSNFTDAVTDANKAIALDPKLAKAYIYKGNALFLLEEFQAAKSAFSKGSSLEPETSQFKDWIQKCNAKLAEEAASSVEHKPTEALPVLNGAIPCQTSGSVSENLVHDSIECEGLTPSTAATPQAPPLPPKFRHDFYQTPDKVVVTIFAKGIKKEDFLVDFGEQVLDVVINFLDEHPYRLQQRLFAKIVPSQCLYHILSTKIEIHLAKAEPLQWESLEYKKRQVVARLHVSSDEKKVQYPSSSKKSGKTDWDRLEAQVKKEEKDEKLEGDAALNKLFKDIYSTADEETRRAMNKSFIESNGTVLSTNWNEVGQKKVEGSPPQGMEMKKWEI